MPLLTVPDGSHVLSSLYCLACIPSLPGHSNLIPSSGPTVHSTHCLQHWEEGVEEHVPPSSYLRPGLSFIAGRWAGNWKQISTNASPPTGSWISSGSSSKKFGSTRTPVVTEVFNQAPVLLQASEDLYSVLVLDRPHTDPFAPPH